MVLSFDQLDLHAALEATSDVDLDGAPFGVIGMDARGAVTRYNARESSAAGLSCGRVIGRHLFTDVAPCMNNYLVATRFEEEASLDATIPYVFTLRMKPTKVKLRLLKSQDHAHRYVVVHWMGP